MAQTPFICKVKDIMILLGCSKNTAYKEFITAKDALKKSKKQFMTLKEFCIYIGVSYDEAVMQLTGSK